MTSLCSDLSGRSPGGVLSATAVPLTDPQVLSFMAKRREEPDSDEGSSPDEYAPGKSAGHRGCGDPMKVGVGYTQREYCDGQSLASPGRWPPGSRVYPSS